MTDTHYIPVLMASGASAVLVFACVAVLVTVQGAIGV